MNLLPLALQALDDPEALQVLGDALLEANWTDHRVANLMLRGRVRVHGSKAQRRDVHAQRGRPSVEYARAVAAVLLFKKWDRKRWPGTDAAYSPPRPGDMTRILRQLWPQDRLAENLYAESPFLRMLRRTA